MIKISGLIIAFALATGISAQTSNGKEVVSKLCGCFDVEFKYAETFSPDPTYKYHERDETSAGLEMALPIEVSDKKIVIQHLLVITDSMVIKHWREEWTYENPVVWVYKGDKTWVKTTVRAEQVKGKWTQAVWEVSDEPRYQGFSQFVDIDGKTIWQNTTDAPLPRREYSTRSDYNILKRTNRINITDSGYLHEQDNEKIIRTGTIDKLLTQEKGLNSYKRVPEKECAAAKAYWEKNKDYWGRVRKFWSDYVAGQTTISLKSKIDGKPLSEYLMNLAKEYATKKVSTTDIDSRIKTEITKFIGHDEKVITGTN